MDDEAILYLRRLGDHLYELAVILDRLGAEGLATECLALAFTIGQAISDCGEKVFIS